MLLSLNYINETMYYLGVNSKMQTSHTLCSRPKRHAGALQVIMMGPRVSGYQAQAPTGCAVYFKFPGRPF